MGAWSNIVGVFTDIDDTLTTDGEITPDALQALTDLRDAGLPVIAVTGRPVGWSAPFALAWPLRAIVAENGAVALIPGDIDQISRQRLSGKREQLSKIYQQDAATRVRNFDQLQRAAARVLREVPGSTLAHDSAGRETDIAIDHSEFSHLDDARIAQAVAVLQAEGLNATVSSIHINGWIGTHDKWQGACWIARTLLGRDLPAEAGRWLYVGDSTNDQVMFEHLPQSVGVANIRRFESRLRHLPRYITRAERGAGFAEAARALLADKARAATP
ncbi:HAD-IIB family hydrolase [Ottowia testudinis]|uniref:HAD family phosphatase n=1 Tax=Ottowia testudinis TaxID=2816950 RepID=A0A975H3J0_9BURK|nr:HAD-IIB family hydrolase [Ottowia testudinis]QTD45948.1 HAD family phosphatase [Ottowia testudinis]